MHSIDRRASRDLSIPRWEGLYRSRHALCLDLHKFHGDPRLEFIEDESSPYAQLELIEPVRAGEQLFVDYGPSYAYSVHRFARR